MLDQDALVTAVEAAASPALDDVCRHLIGWWKTAGKLVIRGHRGRSPLYRYGDIVVVERDTRRSNNSHRRAECISCLRGAGEHDRADALRAERLAQRELVTA